jgi:diguanylate cyclase (GGDEF)-like protein/PAS domain S-box-containing protein
MVGPLTRDALTHVQTEALRRAFVQSFDAVVITDGELHGDGPRVLLCNPAFLGMTGYSEDELVGRNLRMLQGPATDPRVIDDLRDRLATRRYFEGEAVNYRKDGTPYLVHWSISPVLDDDGRVTHFISVQQERTQEARAARERELLVRALESASDPVLVTDPDARITFASRGLAELLGYDTAELVGRRPSDFHADDAAEAQAALLGAVRRRVGSRATCQWRHRDGRAVDVDVTVTVVQEPDGTVDGLVCTAKDITVSVQRERALRALATTDALTGLLTRRAGETALAALETSGDPYSVLLGDIDHFKRVNDTHGHQVGDAVLRRVAATVRAAVRSHDVPIRWGGEEVLVLLPGADGVAAAALAERLRVGIAAGTVGDVAPVTISIGVATGAPGARGGDVVAQADTALYAAKRAGRDRVATVT